MKTLSKYITVLFLIFLSNYILYSQIGKVEILPFKKDNLVLLNFKTGFDIDNDGLKEVIGIATYCDSRGNIIRGTSILAAFEKTSENDFELFWQYNLPENISGDFTDLLFSDIDQDGVMDIIVVSNYYNTQLNNDTKNRNLFLFKITESGIIEDSFLSSHRVEYFKNIESIRVCDIDGDGKQEFILLTNGKDPAVSFFHVSHAKEITDYQLIYNIDKKNFLYHSLLIGNFNDNPGNEIALLGENESLKLFTLKDSIEVINLVFTDSLRVQFDFKNIVVSDLNGDKFSEIIVPLKKGGLKVLFRENNEYKLFDFTDVKNKIDNILTTDIDCDGLENILLLFENNVELTNYEYTAKGQYHEESSWNKSVLTESELGEMDILQMVPNFSNTGCLKNIYASFMHPNFDQHGLFIITPGQDRKIEKINQIVKEDIVIQQEEMSPEKNEGKPIFWGIDSTLNLYRNVKGERDKLAYFREQKIITIKNDNFGVLPVSDYIINWNEELSKKIELNLLPPEEIDYTINAPGGVKFNLNDQRFSWKPAENQIGFHNVEARFYWNNEELIEQFSVYVNDPIKIINKLPERDIIQIGEMFRYQIQVLDKNLEKYIIYKMIEYPEGATLNKNGVLKWKPEYDQADWYDFKIEISDGFSKELLEFSLFVNHPVHIVTKENLISVTNRPFYYKALLDDNNQGAFLIQYKKSPKIFDWKHSGIYETKILDSNVRKNLSRLINRFYVVNSGGKFQDFEIFEIFEEDDKLVMVYHYSGENKPTFSDIFQNIFSTLKIPIPNHTPFTQQGFYNYSLAKSLSGVVLNSLGEVKWIPDNSQIGQKNISIIVSDGYYSSEKNLPVFVNSPPEIHSVPDEIAFVKKMWKYQILAKDENSEERLQFFLEESPENSTITPEGIISWMPKEDQLQKDQFFNISVFDGKTKTFQQFYVHINEKPQIISRPKTRVVSGKVYEYFFVANDTEKGVVTYEAVQLPENSEFDVHSGKVTWKSNNKQLGYNKFILKATDNYGEFVQHEFVVRVVQKPVLMKKTLIYTGISLMIGVILFVVM